MLVLVPLEIGNEHLDRAAGHALVDLPDRLGEDVRAEVGQVVAIDRRDHRVLELHLGDRLRRRARAPSMSYFGGRP